MPIELYPSIAKIKRNGVYENLPGFVTETGAVATQQMIATSESTATAQYVHNKGEYFRLNDTLYQAIVKINVGDAIVVGTNCEVAVLGNDVTHIANSIADYELGIATAGHSTGEYFMVDEVLYVATDDIQVGDNISTSTNCKLAVVGDELSELHTDTTKLDANKGSAIYKNANGSIAVFTDAAKDAPLKDIQLANGATKVWRTGINLLPMPIQSGSYSYTTTVTVNDDKTFYFTKTSGNGWVHFNLGTFFLKAGTYIIREVSDNSQNERMVIKKVSDDSIITNTQYNKNSVFTLEEDTEVYADWSRSATANNLLVKLMLFTGNKRTAGDYAPYNGAVYDVTPNVANEITTLSGYNQIFANSGNVSVSYIADTDEYITNNIKESWTASKTVSDGVVEDGSIDTANGTNIATSTGRKRTISYLPSDVTKLSFAATYATNIYAYQKDNGSYVGAWKGDGWSKDYRQFKTIASPVELSLFEDYDYLYRVVFVPDSGTSDALNLQFEKNLKLDIAENTIEHYTVGTNGNFTTFTEMLAALKDNINEKIVTVAPGEYDIFDEIGGATFVASIDTTKSWREYNYVVPPNTTIVGVGDVTLKWTPTDEQIIDQSHAFIFSPLNLMGNCRIENIKVVCSNGRYAIHDETSGINYFNGSKHEFVNVTAIFESSTYGGRYAYGAGHNRNCKFYFKNCIFAATVEPWSSHDWPATAVQKSTFIFDNCIFKNSSSNALSGLRLSSSDTVGRLDDVHLNGCALSHVSFGAESGSTPIKQGYEVTAMLCNDFTANYNSRIDEADRITPNKYLTIPTT